MTARRHCFRLTLCLALLWPVASLLRGADPVTVTIYSTGDVHEATANLARIARIVRDKRAADPNVLFLDTGDWFSRGDLAIMYTHGEAMVELMAAAGYDAAIFGNNEFTYGTRRIVTLLDRYNLPVLGANATWPADLRPKNFAAWRLFRLKGVNVAVIGTFTQVGNHMQDQLLKIGDVGQAVRAVMPEVRKQADLVVLITHMGTAFDHLYATLVPGLDVIVGGHDHALFEKMTTAGPGGAVVIQHAGWLGQHLGQVTLTWNGRKVVGRQAGVIAIRPDMLEDLAVKAVRDRWLAALSADSPLATLPAGLPREQVSLWLAGAVRARSGADVVLAAGTLARAGLPAGPLTPRGLLAATPRVDIVRFTVADEAALYKLLAKLRSRQKDLLLAGAPAAGRPIRLAWPCARIDAPLEPRAWGLDGPEVTGLERIADFSLWHAAIEQARAKAPPLPAAPATRAALSPAAVHP